MAVGTAQRSTNTMDEFVRKMLHLISDAKATPDIDDQRDLPFLVDLETSILQYIRQPMQEAGAPTGEGSPFAPDAGGGMGGPPGGPPPGMGGPPPQTPAGLTPGMPAGQSANMVSELQRSIG